MLHLLNTEVVAPVFTVIPDGGQYQSHQSFGYKEKLRLITPITEPDNETALLVVPAVIVNHLLSWSCRRTDPYIPRCVTYSTAFD